jgi:hypothetical protein
VALLLPCAATALVLGRTGRMATRGLGRWARGSVPRSAVALGVATMVLGATAAAWWPDGEYEPIRPGERGTVPEAIAGLGHVPSGWPASARDGHSGREPMPAVTGTHGAGQERRQPDPGAPGEPSAQRRQDQTPPRPAPPPLEGEVPADDDWPGSPAPVPTPDSTPTTSPEPAASTPPTATPDPTATTTPTPTPTPTPDPTTTPEPSTTPEPTPTPEATTTPQPATP